MQAITNQYAPVDNYFMLLLESLHSVILHVAVKKKKKKTPLIPIYILLCRYLNQSLNVESFIIMKTQLILVVGI